MTDKTVPEGMETTAEERAGWQKLAAADMQPNSGIILILLRDINRALAEIARLTAEQPSVSPTMIDAGVLAAEAWDCGSPLTEVEDKHLTREFVTVILSAALSARQPPVPSPLEEKP